jgi:hypothetical protein
MYSIGVQILSIMEVSSGVETGSKIFGQQRAIEKRISRYPPIIQPNIENSLRAGNCVWRESDSKKWAVIEAVTNPPMWYTHAFPRP